MITSWPWFVDLSVTKVLEGALPCRHVTVLSLQHTLRNNTESTWLLRRHTAGASTSWRHRPDFRPPSVHPKERRRSPICGQVSVARWTISATRASVDTRVVLTSDPSELKALSKQLH